MSNLPSSSSPSARSSRVRASTMHSASPDWSRLPDNIPSIIAKYLPARIDVVHFRAVCHLFLSTVPTPTKSKCPLSILTISFPAVHSRYQPHGYFILVESRLYTIAPLTGISDADRATKTWIVKVQVSSSGKFRVEHPLSRYPFQSLSNQLPRSLNFLDYRVREIAKAYRLELVAYSEGTADDFNNQKPPFFFKVVVSTCFDENDDGFSVMALYDICQLGVWRNIDKKWTDIEEFCQGSFVTLHPVSLIITHVIDPGCSINYALGPRYLVKSRNDLFIVIKYTTCYLFDPNELGEVRFCVCKLDEEKPEWIEMVDELEDMVFFLSEDCSYSVSANEFAGCIGYSVYYAEDFYGSHSNHPWKNAKIFYLKENTPRWLLAFPGYSKIFTSLHHLG